MLYVPLQTLLLLSQLWCEGYDRHNPWRKWQGFVVELLSSWNFCNQGWLTCCLPQGQYSLPMLPRSFPKLHSSDVDWEDMHISRNCIGTWLQLKTWTLWNSFSRCHCRINRVSFYVLYKLLMEERGNSAIDQAGSLCPSPESIVNTLWFNNSIHFGLRQGARNTDQKSQWADSRIRVLSKSEKVIPDFPLLFSVRL
mgnify:CR=1 FL=1